jgi:hypothetical protein
VDRNDIESRLVRAFVVRDRRERYLEGLSNPKRRSKILNRLNHHIDDIDPRFRVTLPAAHHSPAAVEEMLRSRGAPSMCYVMSSWDRLDAREMLLGEALSDVIGHQMGTLISCVPGQLGFYESEEPKTRYILERKAG